MMGVKVTASTNPKKRSSDRTRHWLRRRHFKRPLPLNIHHSHNCNAYGTSHCMLVWHSIAPRHEERSTISDNLDRILGNDKTALIASIREFPKSETRSILISHLNCSVIEVGSLESAMDQLGTRSDINLAIFDIGVFEESSAEAVRTLRELAPDVQIAVVSASRDRQDILTALEAGVHGYILADDDAVLVRRALEMILAGQIYIPYCVADIPLRRNAPLVQPLADRNAERIHWKEAQPQASYPLTLRQREVLRLLVLGKSNKEIARLLKIGEGTVKIHLAALFQNLGVSNRSAAAAVGATLLTKKK